MAAADVVWSVHSIAASETARALLFESHGLLLALPADAVSEVIDTPTIFPIPAAPQWYAGLSDYRNRPVAVIDVAAFLVPRSPVQQYKRAVAVRVAFSTYLITADRILNLCRLPVASTQLPEQVVPDYADHRAIKQVSTYDGRLLAVIDLPELLRCTKLLRECAFN